MKICFVSAPNPDESGGIGIYVRRLVEKTSKIKENEVFWVYRGKEDRKYIKNGINFVEIKIPFSEEVKSTSPMKRGYFSIRREFMFNKKVKDFLLKDGKDFGLINSHATWGYWMKSYKKPKNQKIIHTYHGVSKNFLKTQTKRFKGIKKIIYSLSSVYGKSIEKPPMKKANKIICVSNKVKRDLIKIYFKRPSMEVLRTGVDLKDFKIREKNRIKKQLKLNPKYSYALYLSSGLGWNKGLDRVINVSKEIYKLNKNYRVLLVGPEEQHVKKYLKNPFVVYLGKIPRDKIPLFYNACDITYCLSRYEGGAPIMVASEAMSSGSLVVCSKSSEQEIIFDMQNGVIINEYGKKDAQKINSLLGKGNKKSNNIKKQAIKITKSLSLDKWLKKYFEILEIK